ncbi:MAG: hypothetical protein IJT90_06470 [Bacteroidaceae bacterium]|nr:hypothetical protein [Bacteroidaceae bacterium]
MAKLPLFFGIHPPHSQQIAVLPLLSAQKIAANTPFVLKNDSSGIKTTIFSEKIWSFKKKDVSLHRF